MRDVSRASSGRTKSNGRSANGTGISGRGCIPIAPSHGVMRQLKTSESVARDIVEQGLVTGDSLPSEAVMLEEHGVSRESLREALRLLEVQGLLSIRRGPG